MNIWVLNHYGGPADRQTTGNYDLGRQLIRKGHAVTIFASSFSHYRFIEERLRPGEKYRIENHEGVKFIWLKTTGYCGSDWRRVANMLSYAWRAFRVGSKLNENPDIIIGTCPHTFAVFAAYLLALRRKAHFFFEVRDLWPQTLIDVGALSNRNPITWVWRALEKFLYKKAARILTIAPGMGAYISRLGISQEKIIYIPNGVDLARYESVKEYDGGISKPFTFVYLGGHARYNGVGVIVDTASILQNKGQDHLKFLIVGDGPEKPALVQRARELNLRNVEFRPLIPKAEIASVLSEGSAFIHHIINIPVLQYGVSSNKLFDYMASARPVIFAVNSANNPVAEAEAGCSIPPENPEAMAVAVMDVAGMTPAERLRLGKNGRKYVEQYHDIKLLAEKLESACVSALSGG